MKDVILFQVHTDRFLHFSSVGVSFRNRVLEGARSESVANDVTFYFFIQIGRKCFDGLAAEGIDNGIKAIQLAFGLRPGVFRD